MGAAGPTGPAGLAGPTGATGAAGPPGVSGLVRVAVTSAVDSLAPKSATATCAAGQRALGGGGVATGAGAPADLAIVRSEPTVDGSGNPNGWIVTVNETDPIAGTWSVTAVALCATVT